VKVLSTAEQVIEGRRHLGSTGHSRYLHPDTTSRYAISAVVAGGPERAPLDDGGFGAGDLVRRFAPLFGRGTLLGS